MPNKHYNRGSAFERRIKRELEGVDYYVVKSGGSKGLVDLVATSPAGNSLWFQCRKNGAITHAELSNLRTLAEDYQVSAYLVSKPKRNEAVRCETLNCGKEDVDLDRLEWVDD